MLTRVDIPFGSAETGREIGVLVDSSHLDAASFDYVSLGLAQPHDLLTVLAVPRSTLHRPQCDIRVQDRLQRVEITAPPCSEPLLDTRDQVRPDCQ
jgi:hypothetical protein